MRFIAPVWRDRTNMGRARQVGLAGALCTYAGILLWALFMLVSWIVGPYDPRGDWGKLPEILTADALLALLALLAVLVPR